MLQPLLCPIGFRVVRVAAVENREQNGLIFVYRVDGDLSGKRLLRDKFPRRFMRTEHRQLQGKTVLFLCQDPAFSGILGGSASRGFFLLAAAGPFARLCRRLTVC